MASKHCTKCKELKPFSEFYKNKSKNCKVKSSCKDCDKLYSRNYKMTKNGLISCIYNNQKTSSKIRGLSLPDYTRKELINWVIPQPIFHLLFKMWENSGYKTSLTPSFDRINDYQGYKLKNLKIMTWKENEAKGNYDRKNGINNKKSREVNQMSLDGIFIKKHYSLASACRSTGAGLGNLWCCCNSRAKTAGGFKWEYAN